MTSHYIDLDIDLKHSCVEAMFGIQLIPLDIKKRFRTESPFQTSKSLTVNIPFSGVVKNTLEDHKRLIKIENNRGERTSFVLSIPYQTSSIGAPK